MDLSLVFLEMHRWHSGAGSDSWPFKLGQCDVRVTQHPIRRRKNVPAPCTHLEGPHVVLKLCFSSLPLFSFYYCHVASIYNECNGTRNILKFSM